MLIYFLLAVGTGCIWAVQPIINAGLAKSVGTIMASCISFGVGWILLVLAVIGAKQHTGTPIEYGALFGTQPQYYLGGVIGATVVLVMTYVVPRFGAGASLASTITGQMIMAALIDQFGLFGAPKADLTVARLIGFVLLIVGVNLIVRK